MLHGYVTGVYDHQGGPRGGEKTFSESMLMGMAQRQLGIGTLTLRTMLSLDPLMGKSGYPFLLQIGETANGVDDNKNGLVDEGQLVLTRNNGQANQQSVVLAHRVAKLLEGETLNHADDNGNGLIDESGFCVFREGNLLRIRLTLQRSLRPGQIIQATVETGVRLRN
jgi:hypothetical protein